jgi:AcrR family transcriptional regulator
MKPAPGAVAEVMPLHQARKDFTRARICAAARRVFFTTGFAATTLEQIAEAAGTRRSTLYTHFRDKEEILEAVTHDYLGAVKAVIGRLPAPRPGLEEVHLWVREFAALALREKVPTVLLIQTGHGWEVPAAVRNFGDAMIAALAARLPAFARMSAAGEAARLDKARGIAVLRELGCALCLFVIGQADADVHLIVAGEMFHRFVSAD